MPKINVFENYYKEYDEWFTKNHHAYISELNAVKALIPPNKRGMEIGVGTGKFALPLGITIGVDPSPKMAAISRDLGLEVYEAAAEDLPFPDAVFDFVLMVTTICFVDDLEKSFLEAYRILKSQGTIVIAFVDRESELGQLYLTKKEKSRFYKEATFYSTEEVVFYLKKAGFHTFQFRQTLFHRIIEEIEETKEGFGEGSFVVVSALK